MLGIFQAYLGSFAWADIQRGYTAYQSGDYGTAVKEWRPLAEQGHAEAQYNLGFLYDKGLGVPKDYSEALHWYGQAAEQGDAYAQYNLGVFYYNAWGVPQDYVLAHVWWNLSSARGHGKAAEWRDRVSKEMTHDQIAEAQKLARAWRPKRKQ